MQPVHSPFCPPRPYFAVPGRDPTLLRPLTVRLVIIAGRMHSRERGSGRPGLQGAAILRSLVEVRSRECVSPELARALRRAVAGDAGLSAGGLLQQKHLRESARPEDRGRPGTPTRESGQRRRARLVPRYQKASATHFCMCHMRLGKMNFQHALHIVLRLPGVQFAALTQNRSKPGPATALFLDEVESETIVSTTATSRE